MDRITEHLLYQTELFTIFSVVSNVPVSCHVSNISSIFGVVNNERSSISSIGPHVSNPISSIQDQGHHMATLLTVQLKGTFQWPPIGMTHPGGPPHGNPIKFFL